MAIARWLRSGYAFRVQGLCNGRKAIAVRVHCEYTLHDGSFNLVELQLGKKAIGQSQSERAQERWIEQELPQTRSRL